MALADRIRMILKEMDGPDYGKQARLAAIAGCGRPVVNHWLSQNQMTIRSEHALAICHELGYRPEWLLEGKGLRKKDQQEIQDSAQEERNDETLYMTHVSLLELKILSAYRRATPFGRALFEHVSSTLPQEEHPE